MIISEEYRALNGALHSADPHWGISPKWFVEMTGQIADLVKAKTILDYGAGKRMIEAMLPNLNVTSYDPAIAEIAAIPHPADLLVSGAMLEHVEPDYLDEVLDDMQRCSRLAAFISISTFPSSKILADGRNAHLIVKPMDWWLPLLMDRWEIEAAVKIKRAFWFFGKAKNVELHRPQ